MNLEAATVVNLQRRWIVVLLVAILVTVACGEGDDAATSGGLGAPHSTPGATVEPTNSDHDHPSSAGTPATGGDGEDMQVFLVASELVVGENRFAVGLTLPDNALIDDAEVTFEYFDVSNEAAPVSESTASAERLSSTDGLTVIYADERTFDRAGAWGVRVEARQPDGITLTRNIRFEVVPDSPSVAIGEQIPDVDSLTAEDVSGDLTQLTSANEPNPSFYQLSISDALANEMPTIVLFATPSFCQTRFCGPDYEIISDVEQRFGDQLNFVHVEVFSGLPNPAANGWQYAQPMLDFGLATEPWLYVADADGVVRWRVEGLFTEGEVLSALKTVGIGS